MSGQGFGKWRMQQGTELLSLFLERHDGETLPQPNPAPLILLPLGQRVPALSPPAAGTVTRAGAGLCVQHGVGRGNRPGQCSPAKVGRAEHDPDALCGCRT